MSWGTGAGTWWVQAWNPEGSKWSTGMSLILSYTPPAWSYRVPAAADRFQVVLGGNAVLDRETGLVWDRTPVTVFASTWAASVDSCPSFSIGSRLGWRLPTVQELTSLGYLPAGHPFASAAIGVKFWTSTTLAADPAKAHAVTHNVGSVGFDTPLKTNDTTYHIWCVRGGDLGNP
jgi:hypothetical protein